MAEKTPLNADLIGVETTARTLFEIFGGNNIVEVEKVKQAFHEALDAALSERFAAGAREGAVGIFGQMQDNTVWIRESGFIDPIALGEFNGVDIRNATPGEGIRAAVEPPGQALAKGLDLIQTRAPVEFSELVKNATPESIIKLGDGTFVELFKSFLSDEHGSVNWPAIEASPTGGEIVRAFGKIIGIGGIALAGFDIYTSTQKATAQYLAGDIDGAIATESAMLGRVLGGFWGAELGMALGVFLVAAFGLTPAGFAAELVILAAALVGAYVGVHVGEQFFLDLLKIADSIGHGLGSLIAPLLVLIRDPLVLDLNGDGIHTVSLADSLVHFDYNGDGFAERTGWVSPQDGILVIDANGNGQVDSMAELFGSPTQDGFAVLETLDSNGDGKIDASDAAFGKLRVWRDLNQNGVSDPGELQTLAEAGITSISLARTHVGGTDAGNEIGYEASFTRADGTTGVAQTLYFQVDQRDTRADHTPEFTPAEGVDTLPVLPGFGTINSIAYKTANDAAFRAAWTALTDQASSMEAGQLRSAVEGLLLKWAGVDAVDPHSRGDYVDARHLAFVEAFFGDGYREILRGQELRTYPGSQQAGAIGEGSFHQVASALETAFLAQVARSSLARGGDIATAMASPYFFYSFLDLRGHQDGDAVLPTPGHVVMVNDLIKDFLPTTSGAATSYLTKAHWPRRHDHHRLRGADRAAYAATVTPHLAAITDPVLHDIAVHIVDGTAHVGTTAAEGFNGTEANDVFIAGGGGDLVNAGAGSDTVVTPSMMAICGSRTTPRRRPTSTAWSSPTSMPPTGLLPLRRGPADRRRPPARRWWWRTSSTSGARRAAASTSCGSPTAPS